MARALIAVAAIAVTAVATGSAGSAPGPATRLALVQRSTLSGLPPVRLPARAAVSWCGSGQTAAVDRKPELDLSSPRQVHVTYVVPADGLDQLATKAGPIATDVEAIDSWWRGQDASRAPRFDLFAFPGCTAKFGRLDLGFVRVPRPGNQYLGGAGLNRLLGDLGQLGALTSQKHLVYYDGPSPFDEPVCGATTISSANPTQGGYAGVAFVFLQSPCPADLGSGGITAETAAHELVHSLGAFLQGGPNECAPPNDGHACDSPADLMYPFVSPLPGAILDVNRDDYYGHSQVWFDVQDSLWLSRLPQLALSVSAGGEAGTVRVTAPAEVDCGRGCTLTLDQGSVVSLVASPGAGSRFIGWGGACTGAGACSVTLNAAASVSARFARKTARLAVGVNGKGRVVGAPGGIACPGRCSATYPVGTAIKLRPAPATGFRFAGWSGSCRGTGACVVRLDRDRTVRASFRRR